MHCTSPRATLVFPGTPKPRLSPLPRYALSPLDLIPDFIPVLGYLDDVVIVPAGILLAVKLVPAELMAEFRAAAASVEGERGLGRRGAVVIVLLWIAGIMAAAFAVRSCSQQGFQGLTGSTI